MVGARSESFTHGAQLDNYGRFMLRQLFEPWAAERQVRDDLARRLGASADGVTVRTVSNVARGVT